MTSPKKGIFLETTIEKFIEKTEKATISICHLYFLNISEIFLLDKVKPFKNQTFISKVKFLSNIHFLLVFST